MLCSQAWRGAGTRIGALISSFLEKVMLQGIERSDAATGFIVQHAQH